MMTTPDLTLAQWDLLLRIAELFDGAASIVTSARDHDYDALRNAGLVDIHPSDLNVVIRYVVITTQGFLALLNREKRTLIRPRGTHYTIEHDGFAGVVIGDYVTLEGKCGVVLQLDGCRVVHVYGEKWLGD